MKRIGAIGLVLFGAASILLGLLFLVAAKGQAQRYLVAAVALALGGGIVGLGLRWVKALDAHSPARIRADVLELARREDGEVSETELAAFLGGRWGEAMPVLAELTSSGGCQRKVKDGTTFYVFKDLLARLTVRRCEYCETELPLTEDLSNCPNCGGTIKTGVERVSMSDDAGFYSMDE